MNKPVGQKSCSICNTTLIGEYCHTCGQKATGKKTSYLDVLNAVASGIFSMEHGILGILKDMTIKPHKVIRNYWDGNRHYYFSPGQMIFYSIFVIGLHLAFVNKQILGFNVSITGVDPDASMLFSPQLLFIVLLLPMYTFTTYLSFYKTKHTFPEHVVAATYVFAYSVIICTILGDIFYLSFNVDPFISTDLFLSAIFIWGARIYQDDLRWYKFILAVIWQIFVFVLLNAVFIGTIYLLSPDSLNFSNNF